MGATRALVTIKGGVVYINHTDQANTFVAAIAEQIAAGTNIDEDLSAHLIDDFKKRVKAVSAEVGSQMAVTLATSLACPSGGQAYRVARLAAPQSAEEIRRCTRASGMAKHDLSSVASNGNALESKAGQTYADATAHAVRSTSVDVGQLNGMTDMDDANKLNERMNKPNVRMRLKKNLMPKVMAVHKSVDTLHSAFTACNSEKSLMLSELPEPERAQKAPGAKHKRVTPDEAAGNGLTTDEMSDFGEMVAMREVVVSDLARLQAVTTALATLVDADNGMDIETLATMQEQHQADDQTNLRGLTNGPHPRMYPQRTQAIRMLATQTDQVLATSALSQVVVQLKEEVAQVRTELSKISQDDVRNNSKIDQLIADTVHVPDVVQLKHEVAKLQSELSKAAEAQATFEQAQLVVDEDVKLLTTRTDQMLHEVALVWSELRQLRGGTSQMIAATVNEQKQPKKKMFGAAVAAAMRADTL